MTKSTAFCISLPTRALPSIRWLWSSVSAVTVASSSSSMLNSAFHSSISWSTALPHLRASTGSSLEAWWLRSYDHTQVTRTWCLTACLTFQSHLSNRRYATCKSLASWRSASLPAVKHSLSSTHRLLSDKSYKQSQMWTLETRIYDSRAWLCFSSLRCIRRVQWRLWRKRTSSLHARSMIFQDWWSSCPLTMTHLA